MRVCITSILLLSCLLSSAQIVLKPGASGNDMYQEIGWLSTYQNNQQLQVGTEVILPEFEAQNAFLEFELPSLPPDCSLQKATLKLFADTTSTGHYGLNDFLVSRIVDSWTEQTATVITGINVSPLNTTSVAGTTLPYQNYSVDVTSLVLDMYFDPAGSHGFRLDHNVPGQLGGLFFASGEYPDSLRWPELVLDTLCCTTAPDPSIIYPDICVIDSVFCLPGDPEQECIIACDSTEVCYQATIHTGSSYQWFAIGGSITGPSNLNNVCVIWSDSPPARLILRETDSLGCSDTTSICIETIASPTAAFSWKPSSPCDGANIQFCDESTDANEWFWDFGDGTSSTLQNPYHQYGGPGTYQVCQIVTNKYRHSWWSLLDDGTGALFEINCDMCCYCTDTLCQSITISPELVPDIICPSTVCKGDTVCYETTAACSNFNWLVSSNGTIESGGGPADNFVCVIWNSGPSGSISLDVNPCSGYCPLPNTITIPIIDDNLFNITGPTVVCRDDVALYSVPKYAGTTYEWSVSNGTIVEAPPHSNTVNVRWWGDPGTLNVKMKHVFLKDTDSTFCETSASLNVQVLKKVVFPGDWEPCEFDTKIYTIGPETAGNYSITVNNGTYTTSGNQLTITWDQGIGWQNITITPNNPSDYCEPFYVFDEYVHFSPKPGPITGDQYICPGSDYVYSCTLPSPAGEIFWQAVGGTPNTTTANPTIVNWDTTIPTSGYYELSAHHKSPVDPYCISDTVMLRVYPITGIQINPPANSCINSLAAASASLLPAGANSQAILDDFNWSVSPAIMGSIVSGQGTANVGIEWHNSPGTASLEVEYCGITASVSINLTAPNPPTITGPPSPLCPGSTTTLTTSGGSAVSYLWMDSAFAPLGTSSSLNITGPGTYHLETIDAAGCENAQSYVVAAEVLPVASISTADNLTICTLPLIPINVNLHALFNANYTYQWQSNTGSGWANIGNSTGCSSIPSNQLCLLNLTTEAAYRVCVTDVSTGCTDYSNVISTVEMASCPPPPSPCSSPDFVDFSYTICPFTFTSTSSAGATNFVWSFGDGGSASGPAAVHTYNSIGLFKVCLTADVPDMAGAFCHKTTCKTVENPLLADFNHNFLSCGSSSNDYQFSDQSLTTSNYSVSARSWSFTNASPTSANTANPQVALCCDCSCSGPHTAVLTVTATHQTNPSLSCTAQITKTIASGLCCSSFTPSSPVCEGTPVSFSNTTSGGAISYLWDFGDGSTSARKNPQHTYTSPGTYNVQLQATDSHSCSRTSLPQTIVVNPSPSPVVITSVPDPAVYCAGDPLAVSATAGYAQYDWYDNISSALVQSGGNTLNAVPSTGIYYVEVTDAGCLAKSDPIGITIQPDPKAAVMGPGSHCLNESLVLYTFPGNNYSYLWSGPQIGGSTTSSVQIAANSLSTGNHTFSVLVTDGNGCTSSASKTITITAAPAKPIVISSIGAPICEGDALTLSVSNIDPLANYVWNTGLTTTSLNISSAHAGGYNVTVFKDGCKARTDIPVCPLPDTCIFPSGCYDACIGDTICFPDYYASYQWFIDGVAVTGAIDTCFIATTSGEYQVLFTNQCGCDAMSEVLDLEVYPCPSEPSDSCCLDYSKFLNDVSQPFTYSFQGICDSVEICPFPMDTCYTYNWLYPVTQQGVPDQCLTLPYPDDGLLIYCYEIMEWQLDSLCWRYEKCDTLYLEPCPACCDPFPVSIAPQINGDECCFDVWMDINDECIERVEIHDLGGFVVTATSTTGPWSIAQPTNPAIFLPNGGVAPAGNYVFGRACLTNRSAVPQLMEIILYDTYGGICKDTIEMDCVIDAEPGWELACSDVGLDFSYEQVYPELGGSFYQFETIVTENENCQLTDFFWTWEDGSTLYNVTNPSRNFQTTLPTLNLYLTGFFLDPISGLNCPIEICREIVPDPWVCDDLDNVLTDGLDITTNGNTVIVEPKMLEELDRLTIDWGDGTDPLQFYGNQTQEHLYTDLGMYFIDLTLERGRISDELYGCSASTSHQLDIIETSVSDIRRAGFEYFYDDASGELTIFSEDGFAFETSVYGMHAGLLAKSSGIADNFQLSTNHLSPGIYLVELRRPGKRMVFKWVKF